MGANLILVTTGHMILVTQCPLFNSFISLESPRLDRLSFLSPSFSDFCRLLSGWLPDTFFAYNNLL
jgi:hypothetical protein